MTGKEKSLESILTRFSLLPTGSKGSKDPVSQKMNAFLEHFNDFLRVPFPPRASGKKIVRNYVFDDGEEEVLRRLKRGLGERDLRDEPIAIQIMIAKPERERRKLAQLITHRLVNLGADRKRIDVKVLNAYKPGLSWMKEVVLKELEKRGADRVEIAFKPFLKRGLEESLRWLQEVYPIDEIFAKKLKIPKERVGFKKESRIKEAYRVVGWQGAQKVLEAQFSPKWRTIDYLPAFPRMGKVHPCTGWINVRVGGEEVVNREVRTGIDRIWEIYQKKVLPRVEKEAYRIIVKNHLPPSSPVFHELRFDIFYRYPSEPLGIDEERISPLEALHEDLYFVTLDFFSNYSQNTFQTNYAPGRILPVIHPNPPHSKARLRFTLTHRPEEREDWNRKGKISIRGLSFFKRDLCLYLSVAAERLRDQKGLMEKVRSFRTLHHSPFRIERISKGKGRRKDLELLVKASGLWSRKPLGPSTKTQRIDIPMERPIGYRDGLALIQSLEGLPGVEIVREGTSSAGLPIYSIEHSFPSPTPFISHAKRALFKPTFFINCRHHANEVSSTNAGLKLSYLLATRPRFQKLLKKANVVLNPMENVDGVALLEEMLNLTPKDKLHAGRYNLVGLEYYDQYFNPDTPFGEARVKADIWKRWLPDICADNHGFPSHEWEQPFSGYAPFRFREWWIPRAFFFFYLPFLEKREGSTARNRSERFGKWIWTFLEKDKKVLWRNQRLFDRYWKYRGQWMIPHGKERKPETLPLQRRFRGINFAYRYPHLTTLDFITEVADEVAWGSWLKDAVTVTLKTHLAVLRLLNSIPILVKKEYFREGATIHVFWRRRRPLTF
ncbi:MAG: M14 family metallopeptidase [Desulfobacterota bacterium]|nr:M14 family metallopeptidase [Thermodesulfobacteriota bacterium]